MDLSKWIDEDRKRFTKQKNTIHASLNGKTGMLDHVDEDTKEDVFYMLMFCLLVPQSREILAEQAIGILREKKFYTTILSQEELASLLKGKARFQNMKAMRLLSARRVFLETNFWEELKLKFQCYKNSEGKARERVLIYTRNWLDSKIDGMALKLASHFMRNIGMRGLAILDSHVRKAVQERFDIGNPNDPLTKDEYYIIERKVKEYAQQVGVSLDELDLLLCGHRK